MAYEAIVARIHTRPHPNAERLQLGTCHGFQVVVGLDTKDGELGVFFPTDGQLSPEFVEANDLYSESARLKLGLPVEGHSFGFFSDKRRVRSQSFRGQKSDGFWVPLSFFYWIGRDTDVDELLVEGYTFTELYSHEICRKYETPATLRAKGQKIGRKQRENKCFPKHDVTKQFRFVSGAIPKDAVLYITEKLHGTSGRYGRVLDDLDLPWWKRAINKIVPVFPTSEYRYLNGSKNVILEKSSGPGYYGTNEFRYKAIEGLELHKGEVLYFEIVGYFSGAGLIMPAHPIKDEVKSLRKDYGDTMVYKYGTLPGQADIYVYRILRVNEDGVTVELSWNQVNARCAELGLKTVPELGAEYYRGDLEALTGVVATLTDGPSTVDPTHIREGVVVRVEHQSGTSYVKNKSWYFGILEGYLKDSEDMIDMEESS